MVGQVSVDNEISEYEEQVEGGDAHEESQTAATEPHIEEPELQEEEQQEEEDVVVGQISGDNEISEHEEQVDGGDAHEESQISAAEPHIEEPELQEEEQGEEDVVVGQDDDDNEISEHEEQVEGGDAHEESQISATELHIEQSELQEEEQVRLRRSKRKRMPVMEYWRGQRPIYKRDSTGICEKVVAIADGSIDQPKQRKKRKTNKRKADSDHKSHSQTNIFDLSLHKKVNIFDNTINKESLHIKSMESLNWKKSSQSVGVDIAIINKNKTKGDAIGMLRIKGFGEKKKSKTGGYATHLTVTYGALTLKIEDSDDVIVRTGDSFTVNSDTNYSLVNLRKDLAYLSFTVLRDWLILYTILKTIFSLHLNFNSKTNINSICIINLQVIIR